MTDAMTKKFLLRVTKIKSLLLKTIKNLSVTKKIALKAVVLKDLNLKGQNLFLDSQRRDLRKDHKKALAFLKTLAKIKKAKLARLKKRPETSVPLNVLEIKDLTRLCSR
ncbi:hypothetical protein D3C72_2081190 [compost metagenome]